MLIRKLAPPFAARSMSPLNNKVLRFSDLPSASGQQPCAKLSDLRGMLVKVRVFRSGLFKIVV